MIDFKIDFLIRFESTELKRNELESELKILSRISVRCVFMEVILLG